MIMAIHKKRIEKLERHLAQKKSESVDFRTEDLLAVMAAVERGDEETVKKYPVWMGALCKLNLIEKDRSKRRKG
jgi:hypothetical protein